MATTIYGIKTFKANGTTVVLQPSSESAVYAKTVVLDDAGTGSTRSTPNFLFPTLINYFIDFPEYTGRSLRPMQLGAGPHTWSVGVTNSIPHIRWNKQLFSINDYPTIDNPNFNATVTILYVFVK